MKIERSELDSLNPGTIFYNEQQDFNDKVSHGIYEFIYKVKYGDVTAKVIYSSVIDKQEVNLDTFEMANGRARVSSSKQLMIGYVFR